MFQILNNLPQNSGLGDSLFIASDKTNYNFSLIDSNFVSIATYSNDILNINQMIGNLSPIGHTHSIADISGLTSSYVSIQTYTQDILSINNSVSNLNSIITNISGATGATGPQGIQGATGPQGIQGPTGPQGFLDDLQDVTISSPTDGQSLLYQSGIWVNNDVEQMYNPSEWIVDKLTKSTGIFFTGAAINGGVANQGTSILPSNFQTFLGMGISSGTNANGGYRLIIERTGGVAQPLTSIAGLSFFSTFYIRDGLRDSVIRLGFFDPIVNTTPVTDGVYLEILGSTASFNTVNAGVATQQGLVGLTASTSPFHYQCLIEYLTVSTVRCKIKTLLTGTTVFDQTITSNVPLINRRFGGGLVASIITAGSSSLFFCVQEMSFGIKPKYLNNF